LFSVNLYLGIDFGTSGARAIALDASGTIQAETRCSFTSDNASLPSKDSLSISRDSPAPDLAQQWKSSLWQLFEQLPRSVCRDVTAIAINGTSSTVLLCDAAGQPLTAPLLYNDDSGRSQLDQLRSVAPADHVTLSATSSLVKLLWWEANHVPANSSSPRCDRYLLHQADWLSFLLHGQLGISDYHNALKLGYDVAELHYPQWLQSLSIQTQLPHVVPPGSPVAPVLPDIAQRFGLPTDCMIAAGTTDSIAAFLASGAQTPGEAVTSLGSTLVLKLLSHTRVAASEYGIYSHRFGDLWLVGGASNTGGAVLQHFFAAAELEQLSQQIDLQQENPLDYYPLLKPGERFPINDPALAPRLTPRPDSPVEFLHGLLNSMARIEAQGYALLQDLGASPLQQVYTAGGGAQNAAWTTLRSRHLQVPVQPSPHTEAAYGTALLAQQAWNQANA
jgi:xylulokinase